MNLFRDFSSYEPLYNDPVYLLTVSNFLNKNETTTTT